MTILCALLFLAGAPAGAQEAYWGGDGVRLEEKAVVGFSSNPDDRYWGSDTAVGGPLWRRRYHVGARVRTWRTYKNFTGVKKEYSAYLERELYHVAVLGRVGTSPPDAQRVGYHLAQGEARFTLYGLTLGPEHPELSSELWEAPEPAPPPQGFDRTYVTHWRARYTNTNHHIELPATIQVIVQNSWQFEAEEVWRDRLGLLLQTGFDRYNKVLGNRIVTLFLHNIDYPGDPSAVRGWPNNYVAASAWQAWNGWRLTESGTRLNLLDNQLESMLSGELSWRPRPDLDVGLGYYYKRRRAQSSGRGMTAGLSCLF